MNGIAVDRQTNNFNEPGSASSGLQQDVSQTLYALELVYNPRTANDLRAEATRYLEESKLQPDAPSRGFALASDKGKSPVIRHYGLLLLENAVKYQWETYSEEQTELLRGLVCRLADSVVEDEPLYFRNKIAQLWVDVAEKSWPGEWEGMDELLVGFWMGGFAQQEFVLSVLQLLSDVVFAYDLPPSSAGGSGSRDLGKACVQIFVHADILAQVLPQRDFSIVRRCGVEGWLQRLLQMVEQCLEHGVKTQNQVQVRVVKVLAVLQSVLPWLMLQAVAQSSCLDLLCQCLEVPILEVKMAAVETMHALYHRHPFSEEDIKNIVCPLLSTEGITMLSKVYETSLVDVTDLDDSRYTMLKKFSEVVCALAGFFEHHPHVVAESGDIPALLQLLLNILQNPSLVVSVPALFMWTKLLSSSTINTMKAVMNHIGSLLQTCSTRLLRYETLPPDSSDPTFLLLLEDFDTMPERHAFVGNYRRFCMDVIERIVRKSPFEAMRHLLEQADNVLQNLYGNNNRFSKDEFTSTSWQMLRVDAQSTVVVTALRSYVKWLTSQRAKGRLHEAEASAVETGLEQWCRTLLEANFEDPVIQKRVLQLAVEICLNALPPTSKVCLAICEHIFRNYPTPIAGTSPYDEACKDLQGTQPRELQKLAAVFSDQFLEIFQQLETTVGRIQDNNEVEQRVKLDYQAFIFTIILRATRINDQERNTRLGQIIRPVVESWQNPMLHNSLASLDSFREWLGLDQFPQIFAEYNASNVEDWSNCRLNDRASAVKEDIAKRSQNTPLHATRALLAASTDRGPTDTKGSEMSKVVWRDSIPAILPQLLQCISHSHAFNNPENWSSYPPEMRTILSRILVDRVWQSGISTESRDDFYTRVRNSKSSLEGLASAVRGAIRSVREVSYWILHCTSNLGDLFYSQTDLPVALARALYADAHTLSTHQLSALLKLSAALIDGCPPTLRGYFLPPLLASLFKQLDAKISAEWETIGQRNDQNADDEGLDQEMKAESVLRALTHSAVLLVSTLLGYQRHGSSSSSGARGAQQSRREDGEDGEDGQAEDATNSIRTLCLSSPEILEALILFCTHALRMHDSRCCGIITRVLRSLIPEFAERPHSTNTTSPAAEPNPTHPQIREFFSNTILPTAITSLHEPYFADSQKDLAALIASILSLYSPSTPTPRSVLLSLPGMTDVKVDGALKEICVSGASERAQRGWVLKLLEGVRGVGVSEWGRISGASGEGGLVRGKGTAGKVGGGVGSSSSRGMDGFGGAGMEVEEGSLVRVVRGGTPELGGLADLFG